MTGRRFLSPALALFMLSALAASQIEVAFGDELGWLPNFAGIMENGQNELLLSGYAWHDPATYSAAHLARTQRLFRRQRIRTLYREFGRKYRVAVRPSIFK